MKDKKAIKWYDSANMITTLIIIVIGLIIVCSQSFALGKYSSIELFTSIINHNSVYLFILVYFVLLKFYIGKRYFNYLSVLIIFLYFITTITSFLTLIQSFSLNTTLDFILNFFILIYLLHTLIKDTRIWREFYFCNSPFNELSNDFMFYTIIVIALFLLAVNLINTVIMSGVIIAILDTIYILLLARYTYLYRKYLEDKKHIGGDEKVNLDDIKKTFNEVDKKVSKELDDFGKRVNDYVKEKEIDKKIDKAKDTVVKTTKDVGKQIGEGVKEAANDIKESFNDKPKKKTTTKKTTKKGDK